MSRRPLFLVVLLAALALVPWAGRAASASTGTESFASVTIEPDLSNTFGSGSEFFSSTDSTFSARTYTDPSSGATAVYVHVNANAGGFDEFGFSGPNGQPLTVGTYANANNDVPGNTGRPGLYVQSGCDSQFGQFHVHEIEFDPSGNLTSLWVSFAMRCDGPRRTNWTIGEVRYAVPGDGGGVVVGPRDVLWPDMETDAVPQTAAVTAVNPGSSPVQMGAASVTGPDAADDSIASDGCAGTTLAPGASCEVDVAYKAPTAGDNNATLVVPEADGTQHTVALHGFVFSGTTELRVRSDPGFFTPDGKSFDYVPADSQTVAAGGYHTVSLNWIGTDGEQWGALFQAPHGEMLTPGVTYPGATYQPNLDTAVGPDIAVGSTEIPCSQEAGSFTIDDIYIDTWGEVQRLAVRFDLQCFNTVGDVLADLHGTLLFQENGINVAVSSHSVHVSGAVAPNEPGKLVSVELERRQGGRFVAVRDRGLKLDRASGYHATFRRAKGKRCEVVAVFKARRKHLGSRTVKRFHC